MIVPKMYSQTETLFQLLSVVNKRTVMQMIESWH